MDIQKLKKQLGFIDPKKFPVEECIKQNQNEEFIYESEKEYLTMIYDKDFNTSEFMFGIPYVHKDDSEILYGWNYNGRYIGNEYKPVKDYGELVVGFKETPNTLNQFISSVKQIVNDENIEPLKEINHALKYLFGDLFMISSSENFPESECVEEKFDVLNGKEKYLCLIADIRFENELIVKELYPYKCWDNEEKTFLYGWHLGKTDGDFTDNMIKSVHGNCWDEYVVAFAD